LELNELTGCLASEIAFVLLPGLKPVQKFQFGYLSNNYKIFKMKHLVVTTLFFVTSVFFVHAQNPPVSRSITFPRPAGPEWSWGLPIYEISGRYYNETGGFKEIEKDIPRLKSLNVGIIYLMPVNPCSDDTSRTAQWNCNYYQSADFQGVNPVLGTLQDYKDLVRALHKNGMYLIQDFVPRHASKYNNMLKLHPDWAKGLSWGMPAWNFDNPEARQYMLESLKYWIREVDIDGYRIDVAGSDPLPEVFKEFIPELKKVKPDIFMLADQNSTRSTT
jgi:cyclomaltodextrinase